MSSYDAVVVGGGPNGLAAAITLAEAGRAVLVLEAADRVGGGAISAELTLPGFTHDVCSAVFPLALSSPFFRRLPLERFGLRWIQPPTPCAHPLDDGSAAVAERSLEQTALGLGGDGPRYVKLLGAVTRDWLALCGDILAPLHFPRCGRTFVRFGLVAVQPAHRVAMRAFREEKARALFAGMAAHSMLPLDCSLTAAFGLVLGASAHAVGWPFAAGGTQRLADALAAHFLALGGEIRTGTRVDAIGDLPPSRIILCDLTPREVLRVAGSRLPPAYRRQLERYRYGPGAFKVDWALDGPIPWTADTCRRAGTVHIGGSLGEVAAAERAAWDRTPTDRPFVLVAQPSLFDPSRAPAGRHVAWGYCHVPHGASADMTERVEGQIERFAPGFRSRILARHVQSPAALERRNPNLVGGDISGGVQDLWQAFRRPTWRTYRTPLRGLYLCSSSTPPGGGVHGMCGYLAARTALADGLV